MLIAFMHIGERAREAEIMVRSAKRFGHELVQLTDLETPALAGVDRVVRSGMDAAQKMYWRACAYANLNEPGLYCDTDIVFREDPARVMALDFDIAVTKRTHVITHPKTGENIVEQQPYNGGVVWVKHQSFWRRVARAMREMDAAKREWWGDQIALAEVSKAFRVIELPIAIYNYTPKTQDEDLAGRWIVHYKGPKKDWMC